MNTQEQIIALQAQLDGLKAQVAAEDAGDPGAQYDAALGALDVLAKANVPSGLDLGADADEEVEVPPTRRTLHAKGRIPGGDEDEDVETDGLDALGPLINALLTGHNGIARGQDVLAKSVMQHVAQPITQLARGLSLVMGELKATRAELAELRNAGRGSRSVESQRFAKSAKPGDARPLSLVGEGRTPAAAADVDEEYMGRNLLVKGSMAATTGAAAAIGWSASDVARLEGLVNADPTFTTADLRGGTDKAAPEHPLNAIYGDPDPAFAQKIDGAVRAYERRRDAQATA